VQHGEAARDQVVGRDVEPRLRLLVVRPHA
jgi:hypothetical protein